MEITIKDTVNGESSNRICKTGTINIIGQIPSIQGKCYENSKTGMISVFKIN